MQSYVASFGCLAAIVALSACSTIPEPEENYLDAGARQHIKTVDAVMFAKQDRVGADIKQNGKLAQVSALASAVTLLPMFLEVGVTGVRVVNANKMAKPIRKKLEGHDYPYEFKKQVKQSLAGTTLDGVENIKIIRQEIPGMRGQFIAESEADAVLMLDMKYSFTPTFETLYVHSHTMLFPNRPELAPFQEQPDKDGIIEFSDNIYRNQYAVAISSGLKDATAAEHAAKWAEMSSETLVEALEVAGLMLADTMANDISIDDLESDLNLIPEGYALNTKYDNHNRKFATIRALDTAGDTPLEQSAPASNKAPDEKDEANPETNAAVIDGKPGS